MFEGLINCNKIQGFRNFFRNLIMMSESKVMWEYPLISGDLIKSLQYITFYPDIRIQV